MLTTQCSQLNFSFLFLATAPTDETMFLVVESGFTLKFSNSKPPMNCKFRCEQLEGCEQLRIQSILPGSVLVSAIFVSGFGFGSVAVVAPIYFIQNVPFQMSFSVVFPSLSTSVCVCVSRTFQNKRKISGKRRN